MYEVFDGDLFLFDCYDEDEADLLHEQGFTVVRIVWLVFFQGLGDLGPLFLPLLLLFLIISTIILECQKWNQLQKNNWYIIYCKT